MRSIFLFVHLLGVISLFVSLAAEWLALKLWRASGDAKPPAHVLTVLAGIPRLSGIAGILILGSGIPMAVRFGVIRSDWVALSFAAMVLMAVLGATAARRPVIHPFRRISFQIRVGLAMTVVYLMLAKPALVEALILLAAAIVAGSLTAVATGRSRTAHEGGIHALSS